MFRILVIISLWFASAIHADECLCPPRPFLSLQAYLCQVEMSHEGLCAAYQAAEAASARCDEGDLLFLPTVFANGTHMRNKLPSFATDGDDQKVTENIWEVGITQQTCLGPRITLSGWGDHVNTRDGGTTVYALRLNQPLWRNWMARETRAQAMLTRSTALSTHFSKVYQAQVALAQAELLYWQVVICREAVRLQHEALQRATALYDWQCSRSARNLVSEVDLLQSEAAYKGYQLELQAAIDRERKISSSFNSFRGICCDDIREELIPVADIDVTKLVPPCRFGTRADLLEAEQSLAAFRARNEVAIQSTYPKLDMFVTAAHKVFKDTPILMEGTIDPNRPEFAVGLQFDMPLGFGVPSRVRDARRREIRAAEHDLSRRCFEVDQEWCDLVARLEEEKGQLELSRCIEDAQARKYEAEKERFKNGRSDTYTVITFEQDYMMAQFAAIQRLCNVFDVYTRLKLFRGCE